MPFANKVTAQRSDRLELYRPVGDQLTTIFHAFIFGGVLKGAPTPFHLVFNS